MPAASTPKKTAARAPKKPTDRLAPKEASDPKHTPGMELMKNFADVPVWDQTPLIAMVQKIHSDGEDDADNEGNKTFDVNILGEIALALKPFAKDEDKYIKFCSGQGAMERAMNLAMAWVGQMGEFGNSDAS